MSVKSGINLMMISFSGKETGIETGIFRERSQESNSGFLGKKTEI